MKFTIERMHGDCKIKSYNKYIYVCIYKKKYTLKQWRLGNPFESLKKEKANWMVERWLREKPTLGYGSKVKEKKKLFF